MTERGARVTAMDGSEQMLGKARRRAPEARFTKQQLEALRVDGTYDVVVLAFILHELPSAIRKAVLEKSLRSLKPTGHVAILDHAVPTSGMLSKAWRQLLLRMEPPSVADVIKEGYAEDLEAAGGVIVAEHSLASGTVALTLARPRLQPAKQRLVDQDGVEVHGRLGARAPASSNCARRLASMRADTPSGIG